MRRRHVCQKDVCQKEKMGGEGEDRLHSSSSGTVHQERDHNRKNISFEEGLPERSGFGHADALTYFINRAGNGLTAERSTELEEAKSLLSKRVERERKAR